MVTTVIDQSRTTRLVHPVPGPRWTEYRDAATEYAAHGWSVLPGTYQLADDSGWVGKPGAMGLEPVAGLWVISSTTDPSVAMDWWTRCPYSVLLACGTAVDVIEVNADHGHRTQARLTEPGNLGPIVVTPHGNWLLLVKSGSELHRDLAAHARLRTHGDWIPLPPTSRAGTPYKWRVAPPSCGWKLPDAGRVQRALIRGLAGDSADEECKPTVGHKGLSDVD